MPLSPSVQQPSSPLNEPGPCPQNLTGPCSTSAFPSFSGLRTSYGVDCFQKWPWFSTSPYIHTICRVTLSFLPLRNGVYSSPPESGLALRLTLQQKWQYANLSLERLCILLLTLEIPHLLWEWASVRWKTASNRAKLSNWRYAEQLPPVQPAYLTMDTGMGPIRISQAWSCLVQMPCWPKDSRKIRNGCYFNPLSFGVVCYTNS